MRLAYGRLTRILPRAEPLPGDLVVTKTCFCGEQPDEHYVTPATSFLPDAWHQDRVRLGVFRTRKAAVARVWELLAAQGLLSDVAEEGVTTKKGRLLDWQRGHMAEQPFLFRLTFRRHLTEDERPLFERNKSGERKLIRAIELWSGMPKRDARTTARTLIARGEVLVALTQTEIRRTYQSHEMRPATAEVWALVQAWPAEVLPDALGDTRTDIGSIPFMRGAKIAEEGAS